MISTNYVPVFATWNLSELVYKSNNINVQGLVLKPKLVVGIGKDEDAYPWKNQLYFSINFLIFVVRR